MNMSTACFLLLLTCLSAVKVAVSQELRLFEDTESSTSVNDETERRDIRRDSDGNLITGPEFTLVGTTRIGDNYLVVLESLTGEVISVSLREHSSVDISGYSNFKMLDAGSGTVSIEYPDSVPCIEFEERGVTCETAQIANLSLPNSQPISVANQGANLTANQAVEASSQEGDLLNPFEAILQRASSNDPAEESAASFTPRRIDPEDVPSGMRVVSTPFGDRLVEIDQ